MRGSLGILVLLLFCGIPVSALRSYVSLPAWASPHVLRGSFKNQHRGMDISSRNPPALQLGRRERAGCGRRALFTLCAVAEGRGESKLQKLRKGMEALGGRMPVTEDDIARYSELLTSIMDAKEEEIPSLLGTSAEFLLSSDLAALSSQFRERCNSDDLQTIDRAESFVLSFLEEFVLQTSSLAEQSRGLLREILEASSQGMQALDAKMSFVVSGQEPRYTAEFIRYLDHEIIRLREAAIKQETKRNQIGKGKGKFASGKSVSLVALGGSMPNEDEDDKDDEDEDLDASADAGSAMAVLTIIKARLNAEMEDSLGEDAVPAKLLSRLLQVDEIPRREMALQAILSEMRDDRERAQFLDVVQTTLDDIQEMVAEGVGGVDPELLSRLRHVEKALRKALKF